MIHCVEIQPITYDCASYLFCFIKKPCIKYDILSNFVVIETTPGMAVVLDALASYIQNMLLEMTKEEVHLLLGVPDEIKKDGQQAWGP